MANRNFDSRVIIQRLQNKNYARNLYQQNVNGQRLINNPQNSDGNSSRYVTYVSGAQTEYFRGLMNGPPTISLGGTFGISVISQPTDPIPPSVPGSMYFNSAIVPNGAHVSYPNDSSLAIGTRPFTIEWYQYFIQGEMFPRLFSIGSYSEESISIAVSYEAGEGNVNFIFWKNSSVNVIGNAPPYDTWTHIAIVGTTGVGIKIYQNGVEIGDVVGTYDFTDTTTPLMIGNESIPSQQANFKGNITNFRWVVGEALYTTTFTPPTIPLANIPGTQLLLAVSNEQGVVKDSSNANRTPSNTGVIYSPQLPIMPFVTSPSAPLITSITPGNAELTIYFTPPVSDGGATIENYQYTTDGINYRARSPISVSNPITINALSDGLPLVNDTTYYIMIKAVNSVGAGIESNLVPGTPSSTPSAPTITSITPGNQMVTVYFTAPTYTGGLDIVNYEYSTDNLLTFFTSRITQSPMYINVLSNQSGPLVNGTSYPIQIRAVNSEGPGAWSTSVNATPSTLPSPPTGLSGTPGDKQITVSFTPGNNGGSAITNYKYTTDGGTTYRALNPEDASSPITITKLSLDGTTDLTNGIAYTVQLKAVNANGDSVASSSISVTPSNPVISFSTLGASTWTAPAGITSIDYLIVGGGGGSGGGYDTGGGGGGGGGMVLSGTTSVTPGTTYTVVVGDGGAGGISNRLALPETNGFPGENSSFDTIVALGGRGGYASRQPPGGNNSNGGVAAVNPSTASEGGHGGGSAGDQNGAGGGGGGSIGAGANGVPSPGTGGIGGNGGSGTSSSMSGSAVTYGAGGRGANGNVNNAAVAAAANTGNGARGGGAVSFADENGAKGGSGIIIISYTS